MVAARNALLEPDDMSDHEIYVQEFGPEVAACIERTIQSEREIRAAQADARGGSARERVSGKAELSRAHAQNDRSSPTRENK